MNYKLQITGIKPYTTKITTGIKPYTTVTVGAQFIEPVSLAELPLCSYIL
ncbi:hypothetical protein MUO65_04970 [bacterium]|nr:hypothetical protein [bacterium]